MISYWDFQEHGIAGPKKTPLYFAQNGHNIKFFVHSEQTANPSKIVDLHLNIEVYRFELPLKFLSKIPKINRIRQLFLFAFYCLYNLSKIYKRGEKPDVIYAVECDAILIGSILRHIYRIPLVTRHYGVSRLLLEHPIRHFLYPLSLTRSADLKIVSDDGTNGLEILKNFNPSVKRIKFWRDGFEPAKTEAKEISRLRNKYGLKSSDFVLLTVSRLKSWKRVDRALRVMHFLDKKQKREIKLLIVGHGPERENLERLAKELDVTDSVIFTGPVEHRNIYNFYGLVDIFLSLYDFSNVGNPILEALISGKCIVTMNNGGTPEVITNGVNGILVEVNKDEESLARELAKVITRLVENEEYRHELGKGAKEYAEKHLWTWDERLQAELESIEELVNYWHK